MLWKCCTQYASKFGKLRSGHRTGIGQFSFQSQRRAMPKNVQTTKQLHSFPMLVRLCSKSFKLGFSSTWTENFQMYKLYLEKARGTRDQIANIHWIIEKAREFQKNMYFCFIDYATAFNGVDHNKLPKSTVSLTSQRHPEKLPEVTGTSQGNPGFPAATLDFP